MLLEGLTMSHTALDFFADAIAAGIPVWTDEIGKIRYRGPLPLTMYEQLQTCGGDLASLELPRTAEEAEWTMRSLRYLAKQHGADLREAARWFAGQLQDWPYPVRPAAVLETMSFNTTVESLMDTLRGPRGSA